MFFNVGDLVTRISYNNDITFKIMSINGDMAILQGMDVRLYADSSISDLKKVDSITLNDDELLDRFESNSLNRSEYFYLPGKILHIDGSKEYLKRCMNFYNKVSIKAKGVKLNEKEIANNIGKLIEEYKPDIVVITGHDAYYKKRGPDNNNNNYKNTSYFVDAVREARKISSQNNLIIIAGACQSNYEELIKAGANFASSPKRINIHALDPAIVASSVAFSERNKPIELLNILSKTKYGKDGIGGIITNGTMYVGYPR